MKGTMYFVSTPIGNLKDISLRAIETLKQVDEIYCEDTRDSLKLLNAYEIKKPLLSYHKFNYQTVIPNIVEKLNLGENIALITDAGMPGISDPGSELIPFLIDEKIPYTVLPGACAFVSAVVLSATKTPFTFVGFLPDNKKEERKLLENYKNFDSDVIFYVAPHKLISTINAIYKIFGDRNCVSVREITKIYEEVEYFSLKEGYPKEPRGEYVLIIKKAEKNLDDEKLLMTVVEHYNFYTSQGFSKNDAIKQVAKDRNVNKNEIYQQIIKIGD